MVSTALQPLLSPLFWIPLNPPNAPPGTATSQLLCTPCFLHYPGFCSIHPTRHLYTNLAAKSKSPPPTALQPLLSSLFWVLLKRTNVPPDSKQRVALPPSPVRSTYVRRRGTFDLRSITGNLSSSPGRVISPPGGLQPLLSSLFWILRLSTYVPLCT